MPDSPETLEALQARHRKEQRDLVSRVTQKKKQATKKTRKGVNEECERLERELKERQARELGIHNGEAFEQPDNDVSQDDEAQEQDVALDDGTVAGQMKSNEGAVSQLDICQDDVTSRRKPKNRAKARLARRAAEYDAIVAQAEQEAATMPDVREQERKRMEQQLSKHHLQCKEIRADGHCLYAAVADQIHTRELNLKPQIQLEAIEDETLPDYKRVRHIAAGWIERHSDDFAGFMEEPLDMYLAKVRETGEWGGHMELIALAKAYNMSINVLHSDGQIDEITPGDAKEEVGNGARSIWLGYYRHSHGLGEHYNSLRQAA